MESLSLPITASLVTSPRRPPFLSPNLKKTPIPSPFLKFHHLKFSPLSTPAGRLQPPAVSKNQVSEQEEKGELAKRWRDIMGKNNWDGLLDPLDPLLRLELIKYGELAGSTYEAFISDTYARNYGVAKFQTFDYFDHLLMPKAAGYDVTQFIYCTANRDWWPPFTPKPINPRTWKQSNIWIGFVAVSNNETTKRLGRRDICVTWRGTNTTLEWVEDFRDYLKPLPKDDDYMPRPDPHAKVEAGFLNLYSQQDKGYYSARRLVLSEVKRLVNETYPDEEVSITVTGHSLGAALALLNAYDIKETRVNIREKSGEEVPVCAVTYAGPRVGNPHFKDRVEALGLKVLRLVSVYDVVPRVPGVFLNENRWNVVVDALDRFGFPWTYTHVGVELELDSNDSPYLKHMASIMQFPSIKELIKSIKILKDPHNLESYLHLIDGYHGKGKRFEPVTGRDIALINKYSDFLRDENLVVPNWRSEFNNGMVQNKEGKWVHETTINYFKN